MLACPKANINVKSETCGHSIDCVAFIISEKSSKCTHDDTQCNDYAEHIKNANSIKKSKKHWRRLKIDERTTCGNN